MGWEWRQITRGRVEIWMDLTRQGARDDDKFLSLCSSLLSSNITEEEYEIYKAQ